MTSTPVSRMSIRHVGRLNRHVGRRSRRPTAECRLASQHTLLTHSLTHSAIHHPSFFIHPPLLSSPLSTMLTRSMTAAQPRCTGADPCPLPGCAIHNPAPLPACMDCLFYPVGVKCGPCYWKTRPPFVLPASSTPGPLPPAARRRRKHKREEEEDEDEEECKSLKRCGCDEFAYEICVACAGGLLGYD